LGAFSGEIGDTGALDIPGIGRMTGQQLNSFNRVRHHILRAIENGYSTLEYCQGGAYVLTPEFLRSMQRNAYLDSAADWGVIDIGEDVLMGMYTRAVALQVMDFSDLGEPFANQFTGLPYNPEELVIRGHALIHSVRNDPRFTEASIRSYFKQLRVDAGLL
jgi:hypothetical protein